MTLRFSIRTFITLSLISAIAGCGSGSSDSSKDAGADGHDNNQPDGGMTDSSIGPPPEEGGMIGPPLQEGGMLPTSDVFRPTDSSLPDGSLRDVDSVVPTGECGAPFPLMTMEAADTTDAPNQLASSCGSTAGSGPELVYEVQAGAEGQLTLELTSEADLNLSIRSDCSDDTELACADTVSNTETLKFPVREGDRPLVVVDGWAPDVSGPFELRSTFKAADCGDGALDGGEACDDGNSDNGDGCSEICSIEACESPGMLEGTVTGDTSGNSSVFSLTCSNDKSGPEDVYTYTAPADGRYEFTVTPDGDADFVLGLRTTCSEPAEEQCTDENFHGVSESVTVELTEGETVFVIVDGWGVPDAGPYTLEVSDA